MDKKVKIMQIIPNLALAGAEIMTENITVGLYENGFQISVVSLFNEHSAITRRLEEKDIPLFYLDKKKGLDMRMIYRLYKLFIKERPDVVHSHRYALQYVIPAAVLAKIPKRVHTIHNIAEKEVGEIQRKLHYFFFKYCNTVPVSISPLVKSSVIDEYRLSSDQVPMIYNGIDINKCLIKNRYNDDNEKLSILHIGRFSEQKNHLGLIEAFKSVNEKEPKTVLKLIGSGDLENIIKEKVKDLGLEDHVEFLGLKSDVYVHLNNADIFVLPSLWEGMPITLIEAMATGLPIVSTNVGGVPDMIKDNISGLLVNPNTEQIASALNKLVRDYNLRKKLGNAATVEAQRFTVEKMVKEYARFYI